VPVKKLKILASSTPDSLLPASGEEKNQANNQGNNANPQQDIQYA
jgi:hypothetical protein